MYVCIWNMFSNVHPIIFQIIETAKFCLRSQGQRKRERVRLTDRMKQIESNRIGKKAREKQSF